MSYLSAWPAALRPTSCKLMLKTNQRVNVAPDMLSEQAIDMLSDRWVMDVQLPLRSQADGAAVEAFDNAMRDQINWIAAWHFMRPVPRGTMRGTPTLSSAVAQGASTVPIQGIVGDTLLAGDLFGLPGNLLLMVQEDVAANGSGVLSVKITNRVRIAQAGGVAVTWNKPTALFRKLSGSGVGYQPGFAEEVSFRLGEKI